MSKSIYLLLVTCLLFIFPFVKVNGNNTHGKIYIIALGFDNYEQVNINNRSFKNLKYGKSDAKKIVKKFKNTYSSNQIETHIFHDKHSKKIIFEKLDEISKKTKADDIFIFYVAGLGQSGDIILPTNETISADELYTKSENIPCQKQLFILDIGGGEGFIQHFKSHLQNRNLEKYTTNINRVIMTFPLSCEMKIGGIFTHAICKIETDILLKLFTDFKTTEQTITQKLYQEHKWLDEMEIFSERDYYLQFLQENHPTRGAIINDLAEKDKGYKINKGETLSLIIGCQNFENYNRLPNALSDALDLFSVLHNKYRTKNILIINPSYQSFCDTLAYIKEHYEFCAGSQLLIYIASHGVKDAFENGYIALFDSHKINEALYNHFPLTSLKRFTTSISATNTLLLLDICYSSAILEEESCTVPTAISIPENSPIFTTKFGPGSPAYKNYLKEKTHLLFGASLDQEASDGRYSHSPFADIIISFLQGNSAYVTDSYLLQQKLINEIMNNGAISEPIFCSYSAKTNGRFLFIQH